MKENECCARGGKSDTDKQAKMVLFVSNECRRTHLLWPGLDQTGISTTYEETDSEQMSTLSAERVSTSLTVFTHVKGRPQQPELCVLDVEAVHVTDCSTHIHSIKSLQPARQHKQHDVVELCVAMK